MTEIVPVLQPELAPRIVVIGVGGAGYKVSEVKWLTNNE